MERKCRSRARKVKRSGCEGETGVWWVVGHWRGVTFRHKIGVEKSEELEERRGSEGRVGRRESGRPATRAYEGMIE